MIPQQAAPLRMHTQRDFFSTYSFDTLITGAARLRPQAIALADRGASVPFDLLAGHASALARLLADSGLQPGERVLLTGGAEVSLVIAIVAALRGGFEPALAPLGLDIGELAAYARAIDAVALAGPTVYGSPVSAEMYLAAAAMTPSIRLVATLGPQEIDGAVDLSTEAVLRYAAERSEIAIERGKPAPSRAPRIITFDRQRGMPLIHQQATLMAASLDFIARASIGRETPILSMLPPTSFAGLVTGPLAALLSGATLFLDGPFDAEAFLKRRDDSGHAHLIIPAAIGGDMAQAGVFDGLASAVLVSRLSPTMSFVPPDFVAAPCPLIDLYAIGESAAVAEQRRDGTPVPPAHAPHFVGFDEARTLTLEACPQPGQPLAVRGAGVTEAS
jgi:acyl-CoA synthetase (AMP-forming)/AMP-acid ligase II